MEKRNSRMTVISKRIMGQGVLPRIPKENSSVAVIGEGIVVNVQVRTEGSD